MKQTSDGYEARFERHWPFAPEQVWSWLTDNAKLKQWFSELSVDDLREGGAYKFDMGDGTFEEMPIFELRTNAALAYAWGEDRVRFELSPESDGCRLMLVETIGKLTDHTPRDLAGWHVCLDAVRALMDGHEIESRMELWNKIFEEYKPLVERLRR